HGPDRLGHLLSEPGRTAEMAGAGHAGRHRTGGEGRRGGRCRAHRLRLRAYRDPGRAGHGIRRAGA
uniref:3-oxoacyl-[acyl-carrier-protein] reductase n=1 Tax=Parastrongyloides trichosuri TaxID=131310 RepID=A0A0N4ZW60_PARTI